MAQSAGLRVMLRVVGAGRTDIRLGPTWVQGAAIGCRERC